VTGHNAPLSDAAVRDAAAHTLREIAQQPSLWRRLSDPVPAARAFVTPVLAQPTARVVLTGAGTSAFAGEVLAPALRRSLGRRVDPISTTDVVADPADCFADDVPTLLVSFARSGDSPESVAATELADRLLSDVHHLVLSCNADGELARRYGAHERAHVVLMPPEANDQGFAMTSSFTSLTLSAFLALDPSAALDLGDRLADVAAAVLPTWEEGAREIAARGYHRVVYLGSGALKGLAHESALKVLELTAGHAVAMGDSPLAFRHGPKSVLDDRTLAVVYLSNDPYTRAYDLDLLQELRRSRGAEHVLAVTADHGDDVSRDSEWLVPDAADLPDTALAVPAVVAAQLIAVSSSMALGLTADNPFPSGEVNRVVQGVRIHPFDPVR
jgi:tagatose-6-phosphate ketose/aldose isomerase